MTKALGCADRSQEDGPVFDIFPISIQGVSHWDCCLLYGNQKDGGGKKRKIWWIGFDGESVGIWWKSWTPAERAAWMRLNRRCWCGNSKLWNCGNSVRRTQERAIQTNRCYYREHRSPSSLLGLRVKKDSTYCVKRKWSEAIADQGGCLSYLSFSLFFSELLVVVGLVLVMVMVVVVGVVGICSCWWWVCLIRASFSLSSPSRRLLWFIFSFISELWFASFPTG